MSPMPDKGKPHTPAKPATPPAKPGAMPPKPSTAKPATGQPAKKK